MIEKPDNKPRSNGTWDERRLAKLAIFLTFLLTYYVLEIQVGPKEYWWAWASALIAFVLSIISVLIIFRGRGFALFIDWLTKEGGNNQ